MVIILRCKRAEKNKKEASQLIGANASMQRPKSVLRMLLWILYHSISQMSIETMWSALKRNNNYVVRHRLNRMVKLCGRSRELHHSFLRRCCSVTLVMDFVKSFSQFVCYSSVVRDELNAIYRIRNSGMQGPLKIKTNAQNLIRSKQRKSSDGKSELKFY